MNTWITKKDLMPDKKDFYSSLNMEDIINVDYRNAERVFKYFSNKNLGDYKDLYVQNDTLLLDDVLENLCVKNLLIFFISTRINIASFF